MTGSTFHVIGHAKAGKEFEVRDAIQALGISASVPRKVEAKRVPTKRTPVPVTKPYLPCSMFIAGTDDLWPQLATVKFLASSFMFQSQKAWERNILPFMDGIEADYMDRMDRIEAGERVQEYDPGDKVHILGGPLHDRIGKFVKLVERAGELPKLRVSTEMFGREVETEIDPVYAKRA